VVKALLDTSIVVDLLRDHPPAVAWLVEQQEDNDLGVPPSVWLEIIDGVQNLKAQRKAIELLRRFERIPMAPEDFDWAIEQALRFRLSHNVDVMDCLIAAPSHRLEMPLYTRNVKHFQRILGDAARDPYPSPENAQPPAAGKTG